MAKSKKNYVQTDASAFKVEVKFDLFQKNYKDQEHSTLRVLCSIGLTTCCITNELQISDHSSQPGAPFDF